MEKDKDVKEGELKEGELQENKEATSVPIGPPYSLIWESISVTPEKPIRLVPQDSMRTVSVETVKSVRELHNPIGSSGVIRQGQLVAIMGPSGAGKTTLLKSLILGRNIKGYFQGKITVQGVPPEEEVRARFINQNDKEHLIPNLTVAESLRYASRLRNRKPILPHSQLVDASLESLHLSRSKDTLVECCSGGETKRLAVGLELIAEKKPHFLFLDEPTSGLDSHGGEELTTFLRKCVDENHITIILTIHQPNQIIFEKFSRVFILAGGGSMIYNMEPDNLPGYLAEFGYNLTETGLSFESPSDVAIKIASKHSKRKPDPICEAMIEKAHEYMVGLVNEELSIDPKNNRVMNYGLCSYRTTFSFTVLGWLLTRNFLVTFRQWKFIIIRFALHAFVALVLMVLYTHSIGDDPACVPTTPGSMLKNCTDEVNQTELASEPHAIANVKLQFFSILFLMFAAIMPTVLTFPSEIKLFINEYRNGVYSTRSYYFCKTIVEIPLQLIFPYLYVLFIYWYFKQPELNGFGGLFVMSERLQLYLIATILCCFTAQGLGFLIGIICVGSFNITIIVSSSALLFCTLFSGFFVKRVEMGDFAKGVSYTSFIRFGFETILISIFGRDRCGPLNYPLPGTTDQISTRTINETSAFSTNETSAFSTNNTSARAINQPTSITVNQTSSIMLAFKLHDEDISPNLLILTGQLLFIRILAPIILELQASMSFMRQCRDKLGRHFRRLMRRISRNCYKDTGQLSVVWKVIIIGGIILAILQLIAAITIAIIYRLKK